MVQGDGGDRLHRSLSRDESFTEGSRRGSDAKACASCGTVGSRHGACVIGGPSDAGDPFRHDHDVRDVHRLVPEWRASGPHPRRALPRGCVRRSGRRLNREVRDLGRPTTAVAGSCTQRIPLRCATVPARTGGGVVSARPSPRLARPASIEAPGQRSGAGRSHRAVHWVQGQRGRPRALGAPLPGAAR
jgi:hypothetical protein